MTKQHPLIYLKQSSIHNYGLYANCDISIETPITEYTGNRISHKQADKIAEENDNKCIYLFTLNQKIVLDGDTDDNLAKYINHSCEPNCYACIVDEKTIWIYAKRDIKQHEELSYDYGFHRFGWDTRPCLCNTKSCFGFIVGKKHRAAIKRTKRYQLINA